MKELFLKAIHSKRILNVSFKSHDKGVITRVCVPFDFGPSRKYKDGADRYHFYDLDSPDGQHNLSILPEQVISMVLTDNYFDPKDYVKWKPNWHIKRDWGAFS